MAETPDNAAVPGAGHNDLVQIMGPSYGTEVAAWLA